MKHKFITPVYLVSKKITDELDELGDSIYIEVGRKIIACKDNVRQDEFFKARLSDFKANFKIVVWSCEYNGEDVIKFKPDGEKYSVYRTFEIEGGKKIELYLTQKVGVV